MNNYYSRIKELRQELTADIIAYLDRLELKSILIPDAEDYEDGAYVMWVDDDGEAHDARVVKMTLESESQFSVEAEDNYGEKATLYSGGLDIGCRHIEWLESMLSMLHDLIDGEHWQYSPETGEVFYLDNPEEKRPCLP